MYIYIYRYICIYIASSATCRLYAMRVEVTDLSTRFLADSLLTTNHK